MLTMTKEGWCLKTHRGSKFNKRSERRYFKLEGFNVAYFKKDTLADRTGKFDLRKVTEISACAGEDSDADLVLVLPGKRICVKFEADAEAWKTLMCSAAAQSAVAADLQAYHSEELHAAFSGTYAAQKGVSSASVLKYTSGASFLTSPRAETPKATAPKPAPAPEAVAPAARSLAPKSRDVEPEAVATTAAAEYATEAPAASPIPAEEAPAAPAASPRKEKKSPRKSKTKAAPAPAPEPAPVSSAASDEELEANRKEWYNFAMEYKDLQMAKELYVGHEEEARVKALEAEAATGCAAAGDAELEAARVEWLEFHVKAGEYEDALQMCVDDKDYALVHDAQEANRGEWLAHSLASEDVYSAGNYAVTEEELAAVEDLKIKKELKAGNYGKAKKLAKTPAQHELVDASEEAARKVWLDYHTQAGEFREAGKYTVSDGEAAALKAAEAAYHESERATTFEAALAAGKYEQAKKLASGEAELAQLDAKREADRKEWFNYSMDTGDFKNCYVYAISEEEEAAVKAAEEAYPEKCRVEWLTFYLAESDWKHARDLCVTEAEYADVDAKQAAQRKANIAAAKEAGDFKKAAKLAEADDEKDDVAQAEEAHTEKSRQDWLSYYIEVSDYSKAVGMCITPEEEAGVDEKFEAKRVAYVAEMCKQGKFHVAKQYALNEEEIAKCDEHEEAQQEASRLEWFDFYLSECKFDKAGELACTTEEFARVGAEESSFNEKCRLEWLSHHTAKGDYESALGLVVSSEEQDELKSTMETYRVEHLKYYMEIKDYAKAKSTACTKEELAAIDEVAPPKTRWFGLFS